MTKTDIILETVIELKQDVGRIEAKVDASCSEQLRSREHIEHRLRKLELMSRHRTAKGGVLGGIGGLTLGGLVSIVIYILNRLGIL